MTEVISKSRKPKLPPMNVTLFEIMLKQVAHRAIPNRQRALMATADNAMTRTQRESLAGSAHWEDYHGETLLRQGIRAVAQYHHDVAVDGFTGTFAAWVHSQTEDWRPCAWQSHGIPIYLVRALYAGKAHGGK
jgi:hypothetical protein